MRKTLLMFIIAGTMASSSLLAAPFVIKDDQGHVVNLKTHPHQWLLINYWAPWCGACRQEIPHLNHFYKTHAKTVLLYGVDYDFPSADALSDLRKTMHIDYPLLVDDPHDILKTPNIPGLPMTLVYDPEGTLKTTLYGPQTEKSLVSAIQSHG